LKQESLKLEFKLHSIKDAIIKNSDWDEEVFLACGYYWWKMNGDWSKP
jgi:hypothetical protein